MEFVFLILRCMPKSTISKFLKNNEMIKAVGVSKGSKVICKHRPQIIEEVEKLLLVFIKEKRLIWDNLSEAFICEKTLDIYGDLVKKTLNVNSKDFDFNVSRSWFEKSKKNKWNSLVQNVQNGMAASSNKKEADKLKKEFSDLIKA